MKMNSSITLETYDELLIFLEDEKSLTSKQAAVIISKALKVLVMDEDRATQELTKATRKFIDKYGALEEKPLFLDIE